MQDVTFAVFKHKGKIIAGTVVGLIAAVIVYVRWPATYQSDAKLLVRYVVDRSAVDAIDSSNSASAQSGKMTENEAQILSSWDLATEVAQAIGPKRLCPEIGDDATVDNAAGTVAGGLQVITQRGSDIIFVGYRNKDPRLVALVLEELVNRYFTKHLEVHRSAAAFDFVTQQADQVRARLSATEDGLRSLKTKAGINSVADNTATLTSDVIKIEDQYAAAESDLAEQTARVRQIEDSFGAGDSHSGKPKPNAKPAPPHPASTDDIQQYQALVIRLGELRKARIDLLSKYTPGSEA